MKFNLEKMNQLVKPLPEKERLDMEYQIANQDWLLMSVKLAMKIRSIMASEGINQSELARRMCVSPAQVTKILSGQENLGLKTIAKIEEALGKTLLNLDPENEDKEINDSEKVGYFIVSDSRAKEYVEKNFSSPFSYYAPATYFLQS